MADDAQLLRRYVETRSEPAFAELVQRHLPLVYHTALRRLGPAGHLAEDVAQRVFLLLARKSPALRRHPSLAGWLHAATHNEAAHMLRAEHRRRAREQVALAMSESLSDTPAEWERLRPVLDQALLALNARDREAILLRFFEHGSVADLAARLNVTEAAAYKCVERALERLRARLAGHGITSSAGALAVLLGQQGALAAPAGLAATVTSAVTSSGLPLAAVVGAGLMSTKTTIGIATAAVVFLGGAATYEVRTHRVAAAGLALVENEVAALETELRAEQSRIARERSAALAAAQPPAASTPAEPPIPPGRAAMEQRIREGDAFLKAHPEMRAALVNYYRRTLRLEYADLIASLNLTEVETDRLLTVMMNGRMRHFGDLILRLSDEPAKGYPGRLKDVLGAARYEQFLAYERTGPALSLANELTRWLYSTPSPLTPAQLGQFKQLVQQSLEDRSLGPRYTSVWEWMPLPVWNDLAKRAGAVLSAPQLDVLKDLELQLLFRHAESEARRVYDQKQ